MYRRSWRFLGSLWPVVGVLPANRRGSERRPAVEHHSPSGFGIDIYDHFRDPPLDFLLRQMAPAGQRIELQRAVLDEGLGIDFLAAAVSLVL